MRPQLTSCARPMFCKFNVLERAVEAETCLTCSLIVSAFYYTLYSLLERLAACNHTYIMFIAMSS
jgi:hypothetical protein